MKSDRFNNLESEDWLKIWVEKETKLISGGKKYTIPKETLIQVQKKHLLDPEHCKNCQKQAPPNSKFCPFCGEKLES
jgi:hypothetical protein